VCVCVCVFICPRSYLRNYKSDFHQFLERVTYVRGSVLLWQRKKSKGSPYSITERRVPEPIPAPISQPAGDLSHKPGGRLPLLSTRPAVTPTTLKRDATNFAAW